jgi:uncharacterized repeat protein (TIGR03803 family)
MTLHNFTGGNDGANPHSRLLLFNNTLYGTALGGGTNGAGTMFAIDINQTSFTSLYSFSAGSRFSTNSDGANPQAGLFLLGHTLYGSADVGGTNASGTIFSLTLPVPLQLAITLLGTNVILTWQTNAITYTLQSATNLIPPVAWNAVTPPPGVVNGLNTVTNPLAGTRQFYRLSQ